MHHTSSYWTPTQKLVIKDFSSMSIMKKWLSYLKKVPVYSKCQLPLNQIYKNKSYLLGKIFIKITKNIMSIINNIFNHKIKITMKIGLWALQKFLNDKVIVTQDSIIWPVLLNGWLLVYELSVCGFESHCSQLTNFLLFFFFVCLFFWTGTIFPFFQSSERNRFQKILKRISKRF